MNKLYFKSLKRLFPVNNTIKILTVLALLLPSLTFAQQWENVGPTNGVSSGGSSFQNLAKDANGNLYLSYYDVTVTRGSVQKFDGTNWSYLGGSAGITTGTATYSSLAVKDAQHIYYSNQNGGSGMNVRQFNGTSWSSLPNPESTAVNYQSLAVDAAGTVYAGFGTAGGTVKRYVNGAWEQVGTAGFAGGTPTFINLKTGTNGKIYASFINGGNVRVYSNDVTAPATQAWTPVGDANIAPASSSENYNASLAIDANNNLYLAYASNGAGGQKLNVKKFNGTAWSGLGNENFSAGRAQYLSIAVTAAGVPYVVYSNWENDNFLKNAVYGYTNESWVQLGGFVSTGEAKYNSLVVDNNDDVVVAFDDSSVGKTVVKKFHIVTPIVTYCAVNFPAGAEPVTNVTFAGINNTTPSAINTSTLAYEDFTTTFGQVTAGSTYPVSVSGFNPANTINNFSNHVVAYFDWNHNGSFLDADEVYYLGYIQGNGAVSTITGNIAVPAGASIGNTRMRVIKKYYTTLNESVANPCNTTGYGQAEDYTIVVNAQDAVPVTSIAVTTLNNAPATITAIAGTLQLDYTVLPANSNQNIIWSVVSGTEYATVSSTGLVTATGNGSVVIRATSVENATIFGEITIAVSNQAVPQLPATCTFTTLALTGFNADVVAEGTGGNADAKTSAIVDAANVYYAQDFVPAAPHSSAVSAAAFGGGLPANGTITSTATTGLSYQFENYTANNALVLRNNLTNTGTLALVTPKKAGTVYVASVSAEGLNTVTATVNFDDATSQTFTIQATDWWQTDNLDNKVVSGLGRVSRGASWAPLNQFDGLSQTGIYQNELALDAANQNKLISSITFTQTPPSGNATTTTILAVSICETPATVTYGPVAITSGFNHDIIANGVGNASQSTTVGFDEANTRALVSLDFRATANSTAPAYGLPANGTINSAATNGVAFQLANYTGPNALFLTPSHVGNSAANNGTLAFTASNVGKLYVLTAAAAGGSNSLTFTATISFNDGSVQTIDGIPVSDWYGGSDYAIMGIGRVNTANNNLEGNSTDPKLYEVVLNIAEANQTKSITGVSFSFAGDASAEYASQIRMSVLAITTQEPAEGQNTFTVLTRNGGPAEITTNQGVLELYANHNGDDLYSGLLWTVVEGQAFANIDIYGKVTAVSNGIAKIRATLETDATVFADLNITISGQVAGYCESYFVNGCAENASISSVATTGGSVQISNLNSGCSNDNALTGYGDFTSHTATARRNESVEFTVNFSSSSIYLSAWIDWNQDFIFSDNERVYFSSDAESLSAVAFTVNVPADAVLGSTRIRLKGVNGWEGSGACGYNSFGEVEDYTFNVEESLGIDGVTLSDYKIFPNPTSGFATIQTTKAIKEFLVFNMLGQQVSKGTTDQINLSAVEQGVYMVHIVFENGTIATRKMIKK